MTTNFKTRKVTIDYTDSSIGLLKLNAVVTQKFELDGSETFIIRIDPTTPTTIKYN